MWLTRLAVTAEQQQLYLGLCLSSAVQGALGVVRMAFRRMLLVIHSLGSVESSQIALGRSALNGCDNSQYRLLRRTNRYDLSEMI